MFVFPWLCQNFPPLPPFAAVGPPPCVTLFVAIDLSTRIDCRIFTALKLKRFKCFGESFVFTTIQTPNFKRVPRTKGVFWLASSKLVFLQLFVQTKSPSTGSPLKSPPLLNPTRKRGTIGRSFNPSLSALFPSQHFSLPSYIPSITNFSPNFP